MADRIHLERKRFEAWAESMPYELDTERHNSNDSWPGQYRYYSVQLAWEAWLGSLHMSDVHDG